MYDESLQRKKERKKERKKNRLREKNRIWLIRAMKERTRDNDKLEDIEKERNKKQIKK